MKTLFTLCLALTAAATTATYAQQAAPLDAAAAAAHLSQEAKRPKIYTKSADPVKDRTYTKSGIVRITHQSGSVEELPYVAVPILFAAGKDQLLDSVSRENVRKTAEILRPLIEGGGTFCIEGHASAEGDAQYNRVLSADRADKILSMLTETYQLDANRLRSQGFGSSSASAPAHAREEELQQDRRVLIVKLK